MRPCVRVGRRATLGFNNGVSTEPRSARSIWGPTTRTRSRSKFFDRLIDNSIGGRLPAAPAGCACFDRLRWCGGWLGRPSASRSRHCRPPAHTRAAPPRKKNTYLTRPIDRRTRHRQTQTHSSSWRLARRSRWTASSSRCASVVGCWWCWDWVSEWGEVWGVGIGWGCVGGSVGVKIGGGNGLGSVSRLVTRSYP